MRRRSERADELLATRVYHPLLRLDAHIPHHRASLALGRVEGHALKAARGIGCRGLEAERESCGVLEAALYLSEMLFEVLLTHHTR